MVVGLIGEKDEEASMLFQLLSTAVGSGDKNLAIHIPHLISSLVGAISERLPPAIEPWPEVCVVLSIFILIDISILLLVGFNCSNFYFLSFKLLVVYINYAHADAGLRVDAYEAKMGIKIENCGKVLNACM